MQNIHRFVSIPSAARFYKWMALGAVKIGAPYDIYDVQLFSN